MDVTIPGIPYLGQNIGPNLPLPTGPRPTAPANLRHRKVPDLCGHAYTTFTMVPDPVLAGVGDQRGETPLVTAHAIRGGGSRCAHHTGAMLFGSDGYSRPAMCYNEGQKPFGDPAAGIGETFIASGDHNVGIMRMNRGYAYGVVPVQNPATFIAVWNGTPGSQLPG